MCCTDTHSYVQCYESSIVYVNIISSTDSNYIVGHSPNFSMMYE